MRIALAFFVLTLSMPGRLAAQECREFEAGTEVATIASPEIDEASGLAASWRNEDIFWTHNDSGDTARVFAIHRDGTTKAVVALERVQAVDFEDISVGPCAPGDSTPCVWVADIGDNDEVRPFVTLYRFEEPELGTATNLTIRPDTIDLVYDGGARNAETLMVHPTTGRIYIVDKTVGDPSNLWEVTPDGRTPAAKVATTSLGEVGIVSGRFTGGDFAPDGSEFSVRTYTHIYTFCGSDPVAAFEGPRSSVIGTHLFQAEAVTYSRDGRSIFTTTEVQADESPAILEMPTLSPAPEPVADVGTAATDAGTAPTSDASGLPDVTVQILDHKPSSGCSCATTKTTEPPLGLGLLSIVVVGLVRRRRPRS